MLKLLEIQKYKGIGDAGVELQKLSRVNYLVGENGSGKSSVLEYIFEKNFEQTVFLKDDLGATDFWNLIGFNPLPIAGQEGEWWKSVFEILLKKRLTILDLFAYLITLGEPSQVKFLFDPKIIFEAEKILFDMDIILPISNLNQKLLDTEQIFGGQRKLLHIVCGMLISKKTLGNSILLFDEPEVHLHPSWQKKLPHIFNYMSQYLNIQIFIATHSPFVISSVGEMTEQEKQDIENDFDEEVSQKVYFLKDGQMADKQGLITLHGKKGYFGKSVSYITSKMLGVGLMDFITTQKNAPTQDAPKLILCEGEGKDQDAKIYNIIFRDLEPNVLFVSCRGSTQLHKTFRLLKEIKPGLSANFDIIMVRDRDHEYPTMQDIFEYEKENEQCKVLHRRAIESYLYNSETAKLVLKVFGQQLDNEYKAQMDFLQEMIQISCEQGIPGDSYKMELEQMFNQITFGVTTKIKNKGQNIAEKIAWLITPKTKIYKELYKQILE